MPSAIGVRGVDKVHASVNRCVQGLDADGIIYRPIDPTNGHRPEANNSHFESSPSQSAFSMDVSPIYTPQAATVIFVSSLRRHISRRAAEAARLQFGVGQHGFLQQLRRQIGWRMDITQCWDDLFAHKADGAHQLLMLNATEHHPITDMRGAEAGGTVKFFDDGGWAANENRSR